MTYAKIEPKSRKTDGFKAFVAAEILRDELISYKKLARTYCKALILRCAGHINEEVRIWD